MIPSELTMARLKTAPPPPISRILGFDEIADNTCHFGVNSFGDHGLSYLSSWLYFPADAAQMDAKIDHTFERGISFIFSTRVKIPCIRKEDDRTRFFGMDYKFEPGIDETKSLASAQNSAHGSLSASSRTGGDLIGTGTYCTFSVCTTP